MVFNFIGWSNTGKTGFIESCLLVSNKLGLKSAVIKFASHIDFFEANSKDSGRFLANGAECAIATKTDLYKIIDTSFVKISSPSIWDCNAIKSIFSEVDLIFVEGSPLSGQAIPLCKAFIFGGSAKVEAELKRPFLGFDAIVTDNSSLASAAKLAGLKVFAYQNAESFINYFVGGLAMSERQVTLNTAGIDVPLSPFVEEMIRSVVLGVLKPLKDTDLEGDIVLTISKSANWRP